MAKILIVEDNQGTNKAICEYMKEAGHTLFSAFTGSEALKIFRGEELDIFTFTMMLLISIIAHLLIFLIAPSQNVLDFIIIQHRRCTMSAKGG